MEPQTPPTQPMLVIDEQVQYYVLNATKWARFLSIIGFIMSGLIVVMSFFMGTILTGVFSRMMPYNSPAAGIGGGGIITISYLIMAVLYFIPYLYLFQFAKRTRASLAANDQDRLASGMEHLSRFFRFIGILTIIYLCIIALAIIAAIIGGVVGAAMS